MPDTSRALEAAAWAAAEGIASAEQRALLEADPVAWRLMLERLMDETEDNLDSVSSLEGPERAQVVGDIEADLERLEAAYDLLLGSTGNGAPVLIPTADPTGEIHVVLPKLMGKLDGIAARVPVSDGSVVDLVVELEKHPDKEAINEAVKARRRGPAQERAGVLRGAAGLKRHHWQPALVNLRFVGDSVQGRRLRSGGLLVRQRVGLFQPLRQRYRASRTVRLKQPVQKFEVPCSRFNDSHSNWAY